MNTNSYSGGIGFWGLLQIVFIVLKILGVVNWSWWLVFIPVWISVLSFLIIFIIMLIVSGHLERKYTK